MSSVKITMILGLLFFTVLDCAFVPFAKTAKKEVTINKVQYFLSKIN